MATDTIRTQAQLLTYLTPGNNTVPAATALLAQTARDLVVTMFALTRYSALGFGFVGDNTTDNTTAWNLMVATLVNGDSVSFPPGRYKLNPALMSPLSQSVRLYSQSPFAGCIFDFVPTTNTTADCLVLSGNSAALTNISLLASTPRTAGKMLNITGSSVIVDGGQMDNYFIGIEISAVAKCRVTNMRMQSTVAGCRDIQFVNGNDHYIDNFISNSGSIPANSIGVYITGTGTNVIRGNAVFIGSRNTGLRVTVPAGQLIQIIDFSGCDFDTCANPVILEMIGGANLLNVHLGHTWAGDTLGLTGGSHGITIQDDGNVANLMTNVWIDNCIMVGLASGKSAVKVTTPRVHDLVINGGQGQTDSADVVSLPANIDDVIVQQMYGAATTSGWGVGLPAGTSGRYIFNNNLFAFCVSGAVNNVPGFGTVVPNY